MSRGENDGSSKSSYSCPIIQEVLLMCCVVLDFFVKGTKEGDVYLGFESLVIKLKM